MLFQKKETIKMIKIGSKWESTDSKKFHVLDVVELEGNTWVHYMQDGIVTNESLPGNREYSCYLESFLQRFRPLPE